MAALSRSPFTRLRTNQPLTFDFRHQIFIFSLLPHTPSPWCRPAWYSPTLSENSCCAFLGLCLGFPNQRCRAVRAMIEEIYSMRINFKDSAQTSPIFDFGTLSGAMISRGVEMMQTLSSLALYFSPYNRPIDSPRKHNIRMVVFIADLARTSGSSYAAASTARPRRHFFVWSEASAAF